jgi:hypothetical protein
VNPILIEFCSSLVTGKISLASVAVQIVGRAGSTERTPRRPLWRCRCACGGDVVGARRVAARGPDAVVRLPARRAAREAVAAARA